MASFESPKKNNNTTRDLDLLYRDWTTEIQCCKLENSISYGFLPRGSDLFRSRSSAVEFYPDPVAWFGTHSTCSSGAYGSQMYHFKTLKNLGLINMSDVDTVERLRSLITDSRVLDLFDKSFRIISQTRDFKYVLRATEKYNDLEVAKYLKKLFENNEGINGWFHKRIRKSMYEENLLFHPEIMLFNIENVSTRVPAVLTSDQENKMGAIAYKEQSILGKRPARPPTTMNMDTPSPPRKSKPQDFFSPAGPSSPPKPRTFPKGLPKPDPSAFT